MRLIFLYGVPASGKLTVARELAASTGYGVFHNHLVVDLLLSVFPFGSDGFVALREEIWLRVFEEAARSGVEGMIFTFTPEPTVSKGFVGELVRVVQAAGGSVYFVEMICPVEEIKRRLGSEPRRAFGKLTSVELFEEMDARGSWSCAGMPEAKVRVDTGLLSAAECAREIVRGLG
jgi:chloramphenicol 3-O-phosphotransferase